jgi:hypothetical protein
MMATPTIIMSSFCGFTWLGIGDVEGEVVGGGVGVRVGGGALLLSHGWVGSGTQTDPIAVSLPLLQLMTSGTQIKSGPSLPSANMNNQAGQIFNHTDENILYI